MDPEQFYWINKPKKYTLANGVLKIQTEPETDFWQQTHYGFSKTNAPAFLTKYKNDFTFSVKAIFQTHNLYDQCGIMLFIDDKNWVKVSVEHENKQYARLGSVVTHFGYSDWATTDIPFPVTEMRYRLSLKGQDVFIEYADNNTRFKQMRILHLHKPVLGAGIGVYACSPLNSSFEAVFSEFHMDLCKWNNQEF
jgi:uncharacterized protein